MVGSQLSQRHRCPEPPRAPEPQRHPEVRQAKADGETEGFASGFTVNQAPIAERFSSLRLSSRSKKKGITSLIYRSRDEFRGGGHLSQTAVISSAAHSVHQNPQLLLRRSTHQERIIGVDKLPSFLFREPLLQ